MNGNRVKPAHPVRIGDTVRALTPGGERIVEVTGLLSKRVGAAQHYLDRTPRNHSAEPGPVLVRERGTGRPTKRDRRRIERLRGR